VLIYFYISGHGFGHASRDIELVNTIAKRDPAVHEAQAARQEARQGRLKDNATPEERERNKYARCESLQGDDREPVADARGERREEEKPEAPVLEKAELATEVEGAHGRET